MVPTRDARGAACSMSSRPTASWCWPVIDRQLPELEAGGSLPRARASAAGDRRSATTGASTRAWERGALRRAARRRRRGGAGGVPAPRPAWRSPRMRRRVQRRLVGDWWRSGGPSGGIMIALRRSDVRALNRLARERDGRAPGASPALSWSCAGERVRAPATRRAAPERRSARRRQRRPRDRAPVDRALGSWSSSAAATSRSARDYPGRTTAHGDPVLAHGYAVTGHVAQGLTAERAFVLGSDVMYREWAYTAMSRGRLTQPPVHGRRGRRRARRDRAAHRAARPRRSCSARCGAAARS